VSYIKLPNTIRVVLENILALPRFIMGVNGTLDFMLKKAHPSIIKLFSSMGLIKAL